MGCTSSNPKSKSVTDGGGAKQRAMDYKERK